MSEGRIRIGIGGWTYAPWRGVFYPDKLPQSKELEYAKWMFLVGRPDLPAPLCQIALGRSGIVYIGAAGRANHAGNARQSGSVAGGDGNTLYVGIEWMLSGTQPIPASMYRAGAILNAVNASAP